MRDTSPFAHYYPLGSSLPPSAHFTLGDFDSVLDARSYFLPGWHLGISEAQKQLNLELRGNLSNPDLIIMNPRCPGFQLWSKKKRQR